jgi:hypothetical protein
MSIPDRVASAALEHLPGLRPSATFSGSSGPELAVKIAKQAVVRREYTKADVKELRVHSKAKTPVARIAKLTKRSEGSLRQKALKLGIRLGHRR